MQSGDPNYRNLIWLWGNQPCYYAPLVAPPPPSAVTAVLVVPANPVVGASPQCVDTEGSPADGAMTTHLYLCVRDKSNAPDGQTQVQASGDDASNVVVDSDDKTKEVAVQTEPSLIPSDDEDDVMTDDDKLDELEEDHDGTKDENGNSEEGTKNGKGKPHEGMKDGRGKSPEGIKDGRGKFPEGIKDGRRKSHECTKDGKGMSHEGTKEEKGKPHEGTKDKGFPYVVYDNDMDASSEGELIIDTDSDDGETSNKSSRKVKTKNRATSPMNAGAYHQCIYCGVRFSESIFLDKHIMKHTGTPPGTIIASTHTATAASTTTASDIPGGYGNTDDKDRCTKDGTNGKTGKQLLRFKCKVCRERFPDTVSRSVHLLTHRPDGGTAASALMEQPSTCNVCGKEFAECRASPLYAGLHGRDGSGLVYVGWRASASALFPCDACSERFSNATNLAAHKKKMHAQPPRTYTCDHCQKVFKLKCAYVMHRRMHIGGDTHRCNACGKTFKYKRNLKAHSRQHRGGGSHSS